MSNLVIQRSPDIIAAEINSIKEQTQRILLHNSIEIGRRLVEAKEIVGHGNWGEWLESSVEYSQRTASNLIKIFSEYGASQITLLGDNSNSQALANLTYTQAVALLGIPSEDRETFVEENKVDEMTTRQLQESVKAYEAAIKEKEELKKKLGKLEGDLERTEKSKETVETSLKLLERTNKGVLAEVEELKNSLKEMESQIKTIEDVPDHKEHEELEELRKRQSVLEKELEKAQKLIETLEEQEEKEPERIEVIPQELKDELAALKSKIKAGEKATTFSVIFKNTQKQLNEMLGLIGEMEEEAKGKYTNAVRVLCEQLISSL